MDGVQYLPKKIPRYIFVTPTSYIEKHIQLTLPQNDNKDYPLNSHKKSKWTQEEDEKLLKAIEIVGNNKWAKISELVPGRSGKQCRERWMVTLNPEISKIDWKYEEDITLLKLQKEWGNKWATFTTYLPGRSTTSIKNRWTWLQRRGIPDIFGNNYKMLNQNKEQNDQSDSDDKLIDTADKLQLYFSEDLWKKMLSYPKL